ncbi:hypothetical protein [uncultured Treponema sp.]|uniref:hypothetical protein n=1 Tax=uncultured Treponema sp. TaxID=162155 RepID=UPI0025D9A109|nr:hypothetical protein [uncultured Treponema sp.]
MKSFVIIGLDPIISCEDSRVCVRLTAYLHENDKSVITKRSAKAPLFVSFLHS